MKGVCAKFLFMTGLGCTLLASACTYTLTLQMDPVVNEPTAYTYKHDGDSMLPPGAKGMPLEIEFVCLDHEDAAADPELAKGNVNAADWFGKTDRSAKLRQEGKVYALRDKRGNSTDDKQRLGDALRNDGAEQRTMLIAVPHSEPFNDKAHILVYGKFFGKENRNYREVIPNPPIRLSPPAKYPPAIVIKIHANSMELMTKPEL